MQKTYWGINDKYIFMTYKYVCESYYTLMCPSLWHVVGYLCAWDFN